MSRVAKLSEDVVEVRSESTRCQNRFGIESTAKHGSSLAIRTPNPENQTPDTRHQTPDSENMTTAIQPEGLALCQPRATPWERVTATLQAQRGGPKLFTVQTSPN